MILAMHIKTIERYLTPIRTGIIKNQEIETIDMHERNCKKNVSSSKIRPRITMI